MSLVLDQPQLVVDEIVSFLQDTYRQQAKTNGIVAVSGGIDSALSLTLLTSALSAQNTFALFLPYGDQSVADGQSMVEFLQLPTENHTVVNIKPIVDLVAQTLGIKTTDQLRLGNIMARVRMIVLFDHAKQKDALVCGTENKSEKYLGYFTRFGDEASDIEPLQHLYKTQVRQLAQHLGLPAPIIAKAPSAGLWTNQTDEAELGFSYEEADQVLTQLVDERRAVSTIQLEGVEDATVQTIVQRVEQQSFKHHVPYKLGN